MPGRSHRSHLKNLKRDRLGAYVSGVGSWPRLAAQMAAEIRNVESVKIHHLFRQNMAKS